MNEDTMRNIMVVMSAYALGIITGIILAGTC
jgi:hypothetical protein